jgi:predicted short-subunit dehydrogenase-like oxidoreductase (DUF2520 family)
MATNKRIALIGAGNVATHLGKAWQRSGCEVVQVYSRTEQSASELATCLGVPFVTSLDEVCTDADIYVVAVKDAVLQELIPALVKGREAALFVHTAGSMPMAVWQGVAPRHGVLYPMQTFSKAREVDFTSVSFFVEANHQADKEALKELAGALSPKVYEATSAQRTYLHMAAVFACNFVNHMYTLSARLLEKNGLPFDAMLPLIDETARKVHGLHPHDAQTGPAIRGDENVMDKHLAMLADDPKVKEIYRIISNSIQEL